MNAAPASRQHSPAGPPPLPSRLDALLARFGEGRVVGTLACLVGAGVLAFLLMELSAEEEFEGSAWDSFWVPLIMSFLAGLSTTIGGLVIFLMGESPSDLAMSVVLGLAAGVMIAVCVFDFWLPAARTAYLDAELSELLYRAMWTGVGVLLFVALSRYLDAHGPSQEEIARQVALGSRSGDRGDDDLEAAPSDGVFASSSSSEGEEEEGVEEEGEEEEGEEEEGGTGEKGDGEDADASVSSATLTLASDDSDWSTAGTPVRQGREVKRASSSSEKRRAEKARKQDAERHAKQLHSEKKWRLALLMFVTLTAHNLPEGAAVAFSALESRRLGAVVSAAIGIHNIPEGLAISVPVLAATGDRWKAIWMTLASGMSEPLGAAVGLLVLRPIMTEDILQNMLCAVAGIMAAVSLGELLPEARSYNHPGAVGAGLALGVLSIFLTYELV